MYFVVGKLMMPSLDFLKFSGLRPFPPSRRSSPPLSPFSYTLLTFQTSSPLPPLSRKCSRMPPLYHLGMISHTPVFVQLHWHFPSAKTYSQMSIWLICLLNEFSSKAESLFSQLSYLQGLAFMHGLMGTKSICPAHSKPT